MATRLDRLFLLLETGSTSLIRKSAAEQLGEVQKLHPHELLNLLTKVETYLSHECWETRIAAAHAVKSIAKHVPQWQPQPTKAHSQGTISARNVGRLSLAHFDIGRVLVHGASLLGSEGDEFDVHDDTPGSNGKESLARQRALLNRRLGLDVAGGLGIQQEALFEEEDLCIVTEPASTDAEQQNTSSVADLLQQQLQTVDQGSLSSREVNKERRRIKQFARQHSRDTSNTNGNDSDSETSCKRRKTASVVVEQPNNGTTSKLVVDSVPDSTMDLDELSEWPFENFAEALMGDLFNPAWEKRHGAAIGLRELVSLHGAGAGRCCDTSLEEMARDNAVWLEDLALRLVCVLALDRFGDFVSDEVVAPVRESCAQTLGVTLHHMVTGTETEDAGTKLGGVEGVAMVILELLRQPYWEVRHGGLLAIKYLLAVRQDLASTLLPRILAAVYTGLQVHCDGVSG